MHAPQQSVVTEGGDPYGAGDAAVRAGQSSVSAGRTAAYYPQGFGNAAAVTAAVAAPGGFSDANQHAAAFDQRTQQQQQQQQQQPTVNPRLVLTTFELAPAASIGAVPAVTPPDMEPEARLVALALQHRCEAMNEHERMHQSIFHSVRVPSITIWDYVRRIGRYSGCSAECFIMALIVLDRYSFTTNIPLHFRNIHRLCIAAVLVCAKLRDDIYYSNAYYASIGGVTARELAQLELQLLSTVNWDTWVDPRQYYQYQERLNSMYAPFLPAVQG